MTRMLWIALVGMLMSSTALAQTASQYADLSLTEMITQGEALVAEMSDSVDVVAEYRVSAEADGDASAYQRLNNIYTQMNGRLLVAEEALANLKAAQSEGGSKQVTDRATLEHWFSMIVAAANSCRESRRQADAIMGGDNGIAGDGTVLAMNGFYIPVGDIDFRGRTVMPWFFPSWFGNLDFVAVSPSTATP